MKGQASLHTYVCADSPESSLLAYKNSMDIDEDSDLKLDLQTRMIHKQRCFLEYAGSNDILCAGLYIYC